MSDDWRTFWFSMSILAWLWWGRCMWRLGHEPKHHQATRDNMRGYCSNESCHNCPHPTLPKAVAKRK